MRMPQGKKAGYWVFLALIVLLGGVFFSKPSAALTGLSLEETGYTLSSLENVKFDNPYLGYEEYPISFIVLQGDQKRRYAEQLQGSYTVIYAPMPWLYEAELVPLMWLQSVKTGDIHGLNPTLETPNGPVALRELSKHQVYRDKNIIIFDVTSIERSETIEAVTQSFAADRLKKSMEFSPGRSAPTDLLISVLDGSYHFETITDMHRYLLDNLAQNILPEFA